MPDLQLIVERSANKDRTSVQLWKPGEKLGDPLWRTSDKGPISAIEHEPTAYLMHDGKLFIGTNTGHIEQIDVNSGRVEARYGPRNILEDRGDYRTLRVDQLVSFDGKVYDSGFAGLFETVAGRQVDDRLIGSVEIIDGKLHIVPHGPHPKDAEKLDFREKFGLNFKSPSGDLVRLEDGAVVMKKVHPFDGSGYAPGKHITHGGKVYMHHGDYPDEKITIRKFPTGEIVKDFNILTTRGFLVHQGVVYDLRQDRKRSGEDFTVVAKSNCEDYTKNSGLLYRTPSGLELASAVSGGNLGVLLSLYDNKRDRTTVISHLRPKEKLLEQPGWLKVAKA